MSDAVFRPDARKSLPQLRQEWVSCTRCELGVRRDAGDGKFVFGKGEPGGVLFIGEAPGVEEEKLGEPFVGKSGALLLGVLNRLGFERCYFTNLVSCRSCVPQTDSNGTPILRRRVRGQPPELVFKDEPPTPIHIAACSSRLYEEVYLVDPIVIVGLGGKACEKLLGRPVAITKEHGEPTQVAIPGAGYHAVLTEKRKEWVRVRDGQLHAPVAQNEVYYHFMPITHPAHVFRTLNPTGPSREFDEFVADLRTVLRTYRMYMETLYGVVPQHREVEEPLVQEEFMAASSWGYEDAGRGEQ